MGLLSRRSLIRGVGSLSLLSLFQRQAIAHRLVDTKAPSKGTGRHLNVIFHGLFVLNFTQNNIELLTPKVEEHQYHAGTWDRDYIYPLRGSHTYKLLVPPSSTPCIKQPPQGPSGAPHNFDYNVVLSQSEDLFTVQRQKTHFTVILPFPNDLYLKRCLPNNPAPPFSGRDAYLIVASGISLCPVFVYCVSSYDNIRLHGTSWRPKVCTYDDCEVANLHFWAEPPDRSNPGHAQRAYAKLTDLLYPLQFQLVTNEMPPVDLDTQIPGLLPEEEQGWAEWQGGGGEGSRPTNCNPVMTS